MISTELLIFLVSLAISSIMVSRDVVIYVLICIRVRYVMLYVFEVLYHYADTYMALVSHNTLLIFLIVLI